MYRKYDDELVEESILDSFDWTKMTKEIDVIIGSHNLKIEGRLEICSSFRDYWLLGWVFGQTCAQTISSLFRWGPEILILFDSKDLLISEPEHITERFDPIHHYNAQHNLYLLTKSLQLTLHQSKSEKHSRTILNQQLHSRTSFNPQEQHSSFA